MKKTKATLIRLTPEQHFLIKRYSQAVEIPMNEIFKEMIDEKTPFFKNALRVIRKEEEEKEKQLELM